MKTFEEFAFTSEDSIQANWQNNNYVRVLELIETEGDNYPSFARWLTFGKIQVLAKFEDKAKILATLQQQLDNGVYLPRASFDTASNDARLPDAIYHAPEFQALLDAHNAGWQKMLDAAEPFQMTLAPESITKPPLVIGFHGNNSLVSREIAHYQAFADIGYRVVMPQSVQPWTGDTYVWGDWKNTEKQVAREWQSIQEQYTFAAEDIVTAGLSKGAEVAIWAAMSGVIPAAGVIAFGAGGPMIDEPQKLEPYLASAKARNVSLYFIVGREDNFSLTPTQKTTDYLKQHGLRVHLEIIEGLGHWYPDDMLTYCKQALEFIKT